MNVTGFNAQNVVRSFMEILNSHRIGNFRVLQQFRNGHYILESATNRIYLIFKRQPFFKFKYLFPEFIKNNPHLDGLGESVNIEVLERCSKFSCLDLVIIHPNEIFITPPNLIKNFCVKYGLVRGQIKLNAYFKLDGFKNTELTNEVTYSFPQKIMQTFEERYLEAKA